MSASNLQSFIKQLEANNELIRVKEYVSPDLEISEFSQRFMKHKDGGKALLFENTGTNFPVLINHYGSDKRMCMALGIKSYEEPGERIMELFNNFTKPHENFRSKLSLLPEIIKASGWLPVKKRAKGTCQEVVCKDPDLTKIPILKCWPLDGGRFITLPMVISKDPDTNIRNIGMYRMQVYNPTETGMHWHLHKGGARHYNKYKSRNQNMPVAVAIGGDPIITYCSTAPLPDNVDEFMLAGFLRKKPVKLVKCITNNLYVPEDADFIIEGYIDTSKELTTEGPFGDHTGFYSLKDKYPVFKVTCITHKKNAIYPATVVGVPPMEDYYLGKATERIFLKPIQISIAPEVLDIRLPDYGVAHNLVLVKANIEYPGQSIKIMKALLGAGQMMFTKVIVCFNEDVDIHDDKQVFEKLIQNVNPKDDIILSKGPSDVLDHAAYKYSYAGKIIIDATNNTDIRQKSGIEITKNQHFNIVYNNNELLIIGVDKKEIGNLKKYGENLIRNKGLNNIKFLILIDDFVNIKTDYLKIWYMLNNIDVSEDCSIIDNCIIADASIKTKNSDGYTRDWPNIVCMDDNTIKKIDELVLNNKLYSEYSEKSPSLLIKNIVFGDREIVDI